MPAYRLRLRLAELIHPLGTAAFLRDCWSAQQPHLSGCQPALVARLRSIEVLANVSALLERYRRPVLLFGPSGFRSSVPAADCLGFLATGYNLYFPGLNDCVPELAAVTQELARDLSVSADHVSFEAFVGKAGGVSSRHYDHDINFQVLLDGEKHWQLEANRNIENPLSPYHGRRDAAKPVPFMDEAFALDRDLPDGFDAARSLKLHARAGSVLFLPRGYWHEVESITDTWSVNIVIKGRIYANAFSNALYDVLVREPSFRAYHHNAAYGRGGAKLNGPSFQALKARAVALLAGLGEEDIAIGGLHDRLYHWAAGTEGRQIAVENGQLRLQFPGGGWAPLEFDENARPAVEELVRLRHPFSLRHARTACREVNALVVQNTVDGLCKHRVLIAEGWPKA